MPTVPPPPKAVNQRQEKAEVMQGKQHNRLRRVLEQQSKVFSTQLNKDISLPSAGKYFLYGTNNRIYWVWDFDEDVPYGKEMHIAYTRGTKSDYIGNVGIRRSLTLEPCVTGCNTMIKK